MTPPKLMSCWKHLLVVGILSTAVCSGFAQAPVIGSANTATADPPVRHPNTTPCTVTLFSDFTFDDFSPRDFSYTPPASCPGPWAKVVLVADFNENAGVQYDRTAKMFIGGVNVYFGTTPEPTSTLAPTWHIERDLTDYSALLAQPQSGDIHLDNLVNSTYTGVIHGSAQLLFYPAAFSAPAPRTADQVIALPTGATDSTYLDTTSSQLSQPVTLPANVENAYLDVFAQGQSTDEFWYTCVPNADASTLQNCGSTAFRETEITIDGQPAGVAPIYPWIFTGGIDPNLWAPTPGVQTLDFVPYRVDLTPFAGVLSNGQPHTVALSVFNADNYFAVTATLLVFQDHGSKSVTGAVTQNTLAATPTPVIQAQGVSSSGGTINTYDLRNYRITGYANTSHGRVETTVEQNINFTNAQQFTLSSTQYEQGVAQGTEISSDTTTKDGWFVSEKKKHLSYPLSLVYNYTVNADGSSQQVTTVQQGFHQYDENLLNGLLLYSSETRNAVNSDDTWLFNSSGVPTGTEGRSSSQKYFTHDSTGYCYSRKLTSAAGLLTAVKDGEGCPRGQNR
ncbi:MAG TPA: peptide-N4-asparagine amidase [Pseudacidobacterium sp.]|nr:peptide-N4-asparagine amidase [Pseudacidobacterium sp.]